MTTDRDDDSTQRTLSMLRAAFEASGAGILAADLAGSINAYNQRLLDMWGLPEDTFKDSDRQMRIEHVAGMTTEPAAVAERVQSVYADPECESRDVFELKDGRCIEVVSLPQRLDGEVIGRVWSFRDVTHQIRLENELRELAIRDPLTGLFNRRYAEETLAQEVQRAGRSRDPFSVAMVDIDRFKSVNDAHGHETGDQVLRALAEDFRKRLRGTDIACRWGGEEFLIVLPHTDLEGARKLIDELRRYIGRERNDLPTFTISAGIAEYDDKPRYDSTIATADARMYEAKQAGRNRVVGSDPAEGGL